MVIDGYIVGATIFMDLNFNGVLDDGEPSDVTVDAVPNYTIDAPEECARYVPLIAHVPVGAIDLDFPDTPITEEYYLTIAPAFAQTTDDDIRNVTPLTTIIWSDIERELSMEGKELTCQTIIDNEELREEIIYRLEQQEFRVAQRYNVTVDTLYSDYIASGNESLHGLARALVLVLQKSYVDTVALMAANPSLSIAFVEYYFKDSSSINMAAWSRREFLQSSYQNYSDISNAMRGGLTSILHVEMAETMSTSNSNDLKIKVEFSFTGDGGICTKNETFEELPGNTGYGITNIASANDLSWGECQSIDAISFNIAQRFNTGKYFENGSQETISEHVYGSENDARFLDLVGVSASDISSGWVKDNISHISTDFDDDYGYDSDYWMRSRNEFFDSGSVAQKMYMHDYNDAYKVTTINTDGTHSKRCGTWSNGESSLVDCTQ